MKHYFHNFLTALIIFSTLIFSSAGAQDLAGAKDHPAIKRFASSVIVTYDQKRFDEVDIPTSTFRAYNLQSKKREFASAPIKAEGMRTRIWYEAAGATSAEVFRNYANELTAQGFTMLYDSTQDPKLGKWDGYLLPYGALEAKLNTSRSNFVLTAAPTSEVRTLSAQRVRDGQTLYVHLLVLQWDKDSATFKAKRGAYAALDIVEVGQLQQNMVSVSASEMSKAIASTGRVALYGILFDTGKADIKPESKVALEEIAKLLRAEPNFKLRVVGHTDNQGGLESNIALSKRRAEAVNAALTSQYGISAARLSAYGVADLAPVASNADESGRTKNRRVELVPQ
jgi:outer membrane protein OmpA-like peptidoglycan-associated protein